MWIKSGYFTFPIFPPSNLCTVCNSRYPIKLFTPVISLFHTIAMQPVCNRCFFVFFCKKFNYIYTKLFTSGFCIYIIKLNEN